MSDHRATVVATPEAPRGHGGVTVRDAFEARAQEHPERPALVFEGETWTYGALDRRANRLAHTLLAGGVGPEVLVGIHLERGIDMVVALLAVHKAGGAYVPLDPKFPHDRLQYMAEHAALGMVISATEVPWRLPESTAVVDVGAVAGPEGSDASPGVPLRPDHLAYVIYTSGSTGRPKGVQIPHGALSNFLDSMAERPGFDADDVLVAVTTLSFDIAGLEIFLPLIRGGRVVIAPSEVAIDGVRLARLLDESGATVLQATPATWKLLLQTGWRPQGLRMLCGGEALPRELAQELLKSDDGMSPGDTTLWNLYGPTETTIWSAIDRVEPDDDPILIGGAIARTDLLVADASGCRVAHGDTGELWIGGAGVARGYLGRPGMTAERFVPHPEGDGERLYRTGDLARWVSSSELQCLGRVDHQVKIRGFRIELGEIESVLKGHPAVRDVAVVAATDGAGDKRLAAYWVAEEDAPDASAVVDELRQRLAEHLPEYMRPTALVDLDALPLTPNRKVDRKVLAEKPLVVEERTVEAPRTATEATVVEIWRRVLGLSAVDIHDDFFALGGHSLLGGQVMVGLRDAMGLELPPGLLFEHPTPARFAKQLDALDGAEGALPPLVPREHGTGESADVLPASYAQERLWFHDQLEPGSNAFNMAHALRFEGDLSVPALQASLVEIIRRHEVLRTRVRASGEQRGGAVQVIDPPPTSPLVVVDLRSLPEGARGRETQRLAKALAGRSFDLARGPLMASVLLRTGERENVFCLTIHHILGDGWSLGILIHEMMTLYGAYTEGVVPELPPLTVQYGDFALWQRGWLRDELLEQQLTWWTTQLGDGRPAATLPTDRPPSRAGGVAAHCEWVLSGDAHRALARLAESEGTTLFMLLVAVIDVLAHRYTGETKTVVGSMHANRSHSAVEPLIGFFVNVLPIAVEVDPKAGFRELLGQVRTAALGAYAHQDTPFEKVLERVRPEGAVGRNPIFQSMVIYQNVPVPDLQLSNLETTPFEAGHAGKQAAFDFTWIFMPKDGHMRTILEYDTALYDASTAERLLGHFACLLGDIAEDPDSTVETLPRSTGEDAAGSRQGGSPSSVERLWLTDPIADGAEAEGDGSPATAEVVEMKASAIKDRVATRRSKLSKKQRLLLQKRLRK